MLKQLNRAIRYEYQSVARFLLADEGHRQGLKHVLDIHRTAKCMWIAINETSLRKRRQDGRAFYSGLMQCKSIWACPVCSAKIQEIRRAELAQLIAWAYCNNMKCIMVTLTFPHHSWDELGDLLQKLSRSLDCLRGGESWKKFKEKIGFEGLVRALELTIGSNAWNPHSHEIWVIAKDVDFEVVRAKILERWVIA